MINGNVWVWGRNNNGQLGTNSESNSLTPTIVPGLANIKKITCGNNTSYAIGKDGEVYSFGLNANGEGGIGSYTSKITVTKAKDLSDVIDIKAGKNHATILKSNGDVYVTGSNLYGELAQDNANIKKTKQFTKIEELENVVMIASR